jgi:anti-sigma factor RsiW
MRVDQELTCSQIVDLVTDYLEGQLSVPQTERFEVHLAFCDGCARYLEQMRGTIAAAGHLGAGDFPSELQERLLEAFRGWSRT